MKKHKNVRSLRAFFFTFTGRLRYFLNIRTSCDKINKKVKVELTKKIEKSSLKSNAKNRLLSELSKILILTNTMGWTLKYDGREVKTDKDLELKIIN